MSLLRFPFPPSRFSLAAFATAIFWWLSLQKLGWFALGWIAFVPLLAALNRIPEARARFWFGWRAGVLCFALINWWILPAIIKGGVMIGATPPVGAALGVLSVGIIGVAHGVGIAIIALLWNPRAKWFRSFPLLLPLFVAVVWYGFENLRATGVLAHSWGALAFSQWNDVALLQSASFLGQHGLSALCVWFAACLTLWISPEYSSRIPSLWRAPLVVFLLLHGWGAWRIIDYDLALNSDTPRLRTLLVQTDISSLRKNIQGGESHFDQAERLTFEAIRQNKSGLMVWPETTGEVVRAIGKEGEWFESARGMHVERAKRLTQFARDSLLLGAQTRELEPVVTNRALLFTRGGKQQSSAKMRVVPFGERAPFGEVLPFLNQLAPVPPVRAASSVSTLKLGEISIGTLICFESCFPNPAKNLKAQGAQVLFILTNDEWCAGTTAPWEHAAMSTLRAVENDLPVAQCANGGYSLVVDARGRFIEISGAGIPQVIAAKIELR